MLRPEQSQIVVDLIRKNARMIRRESYKLMRRINSLIEAQEDLVPEQFLLPYSSSLSKAIKETRFDCSLLPCGVTSYFYKNKCCGTQNLAALRAFSARINREFLSWTEAAVLSGDGGILAALYRDPGAYQGTYWAALLPDGTCANGDKPRAYKPLSEEWSERVEFGNIVWRLPKPALLIALLAGHAGDPATSPNPPMWPHLGLALLINRDRIGADQVLELASKLASRDEVERGLAIAVHIFPELSKWLDSAKLTIPKWEQKLAIPIAAHRLVIGDRD